MGLVLSILPMASAQPSQKPITYTTPATPLRNALAELSRQSGVKLDAAGKIADEPIILRLNGVPLQTVLDKISDGFCAEWIKRDDVLELSRSQALVDTARSRGLEQRVRAINANIDKLLADSSPYTKAEETKEAIQKLVALHALHDYDNNNVRSQYQRYTGRLPVQRLYARTLKNLGADRLAKLQRHSRIVFESNPNAAQEKLTIDEAAVEEFRTSAQLLTDEFKKLHSDPGAETIPILLGANVSLGTDIGRMRLVLEDDEGGIRRIHANFLIWDTNGKLIGQHRTFLYRNLSNIHEQMVAEHFARESGVLDSFDLGPIAKELAPRIDFSGRGRQFRSLPEEVIEKLLNPTRFEPLSFATSDIVLKAADRTNSNVIFIPVDDLEHAAYMSSRAGRTDWKSFCLQIDQLAEMAIAVENGWIVGKPLDPVWAEETRIPRLSLEKLIKKSYAAKHVAIEDAADFRGEMPRDAEISLAYNQGLPLELGIYGNVDVLRFLSTLNPMQREVLAEAQGFQSPFGSLSEVQREIASQCCYASNEMILGPGKAMLQDPALKYEITEIWPDGIPSDALIALKDERIPTLYVTSKDINGMMVEHPNDFSAAMTVRLVGEKHPELRHPGYGDIEQVALGEQRELYLLITLNSKQIKHRVVLDNYRVPGPKMLPSELLKTLPAATQRKLLDRAREYEEQRREEIAEAKAGEQGAAKPPSCL